MQPMALFGNIRAGIQGSSQSFPRRTEPKQKRKRNPKQQKPNATQSKPPDSAEVNCKGFEVLGEECREVEIIVFVVRPGSKKYQSVPVLQSNY
jgi:hypothetical protein